MPLINDDNRMHYISNTTRTFIIACKYAETVVSLIIVCSYNFAWRSIIIFRLFAFLMNMRMSNNEKDNWTEDITRTEIYIPQIVNRL